MAYPYYTPYPSYQPYQPSYPQPMVQQPVQPQQSSIIWISGGEKEAAMYPVAPNNAVTLWSTTEPIVYLKKADSTGKHTLTTYDLVERQTPTAKEAQKAEDYATKADLGTVAGIVKGLATDLEQIKSDVYGVVGKKKTPSRKVKEEEDEEE